MTMFNSSVAHIFFYAMKRQGTQLQIDKEVIEAFKVPDVFRDSTSISIKDGVPGLGGKSFESWKDFFAAIGEALINEMDKSREMSAINVQRLRSLADIAMCSLFDFSDKEFSGIIRLVTELQHGDWQIDEAVRKWAADKVSIDQRSRKKRTA